MTYTIPPYTSDSSACDAYTFTYTATISPTVKYPSGASSIIDVTSYPLTHTCFTSDLTDEDTYTISISVDVGECTSLIDPVSYTLTMVNPCREAALSFTTLPFPNPNPYSQMLGQALTQFTF